MNPLTIAEAFRNFANANADIIANGPPCVTAQNSAAVVIPRAVFAARFRPLPGSSTVGTADVSIAVETHAGDAASETAHRQAVDRLRVVFFGSSEAGSQAHRAAVAGVISASGVFVDPRYLPMPESAPDRNGDRFRTVLHLRAGVCAAPGV